MPPVTDVRTDRVAKARREHQRRAAVRAIDDPVVLAKAARIVREALARNKLTLADLDPGEAADGLA